MPVALDVAAGEHVALDIDVDTRRLLANPDRPATALRGRVRGTALDRVPVRADDGTLRFETTLRAAAFGGSGQVELVAPAGALSPQVRIRLEELSPEALPELFRGQHPVGAVVRLRATESPRAPIEVTVPYDATLVAAWGRPPDELVVLALDEGRQRYRELRPVRVDTARRTLTARTDSLSFFFAGTPGIEIDHPTFRRNAADEVVAISARLTALVAGHATDDRAVVTCPTAAGGWTQLGWFVHDGIPLSGPADNVVRVLAAVEGLVTHELELLIRRPPPGKRVTDPARLYGTSICVSPGNVPFVGAVINQREFRFGADPLLPRLASWQRSFDRPAPYVYWWNSEARTVTENGVHLRVGDWPFIGVMPDTHLENEVAADVIATLNTTFATPVPLDARHRADIRALRSLHDYLDAAFARNPLLGLLFQAVALGWLEVLGRAFGAGTYAYSPTLALVPVSDDEVEVAFVAATADGSRRARADRMQSVFQEWLGPRLSDATARPLVHAGTLYYARVRRDGSVVRERVTDAVWCAVAALRRHPTTGRTFVLALGMPALSTAAARSTILLCERQAADDWVVDTVSNTSPVFDADFAFLPDGEARIVASVWDAESVQPHLVVFAPDGARWRSSPLNWRTLPDVSDAEPRDPEARDVGAFPRVVADAEGRVAVGFITPVVRGLRRRVEVGRAIAWMLAVADDGGWRARTVNGASVASLTSDPAPAPDGAFELGVIGQSARGARAFAPALAADATGRLHYALGDGVLHLATIDRATLVARQRSVDVDRRTGFAPAIALNGNGAAVIAYKDDSGPADTAVSARDDLLFFALEAGNVVPNLDAPIPAGPAHIVRFTSAFGFARYEAFSCARLLTPDDFSRELIATLTLLILAGVDAEQLIQGVIDTIVERKRPDELLESVVRHRRMHVEAVVGGPERIVWGVHWQFFRSHPELNAMIDALPVLPRIVQLTVDNEEHENEEIAAIHVTFFDPLAVVDGTHAAALDRGEFPTELRDALVAGGFRMSTGVTARIGPGGAGQEWIVTDPDPFGARVLWFPHIEDPAEEDTRVPVSVRYVIRRRADGMLAVGLDPLLTVTDRTLFRDRDGRFAPCRVGQSWWDLLGNALAAEFAGLVRDLTRSVDDARHVRIRNARISSITPIPHPSGQQGAIQFTLTVGSVWARDRDPVTGGEGIGRTTEPSEFQIAMSPFVDREGRVQWWPHEVQARLGHLEVDVLNWGRFDFLRGIVSFVPLLGGVGIVVANEILGDMAVDRITERLDPDFGGLANYLVDRFRRFVDTRLPVAPPFEAVYLDGWTLWLWVRRPVDEDTPDTAVDILPASIDFGFVPVGQQPSPRRNVLVTNHGGLPFALDQVALEQASSEFRIVAPQSWPRIVLPGDAEVVTVEFTPAAPPGDRRNAVRVRINGADVDPPVQLGAFATGARRIIARVDPELLNLGVVPVGQSRIGIARVFSEGDAELEVSGYSIDGPPGVAAMFSVSGFPIRLPPGLGISVVVTYAPTAAVPSPHEAMLRVHSNDSDEPVRAITLRGRTAPLALLVQPLQIAFNPSPLAGALPPGIGSTRTINIYNTGTTALTLTASSFEIVDGNGRQSLHFVLAEAGTFPAVPVAAAERTVPAGGVVSLDVVFRPTTIGMHGGTLRVATTDPTVSVITVQITGEGIGG